MLRRGNHHSARFRRRALFSVIERYQRFKIPRFFRGDAAFAAQVAFQQRCPAMKKMLLTLTVIVATTSPCGSSRLLAGGLTLTRDGQPAAIILLCDRPTKAAQFAAFELASHVKAISGAKLPIVRGGASVPPGQVKIYVGDGARAQSLGLTQQSFRYQEYAIHCGADEIVLVGKDAGDFAEVTYDMEHLGDWTRNMNWPGFWEERGTLHAVYDFLRDACGVRWLNPTDTGTLIPHQPTLTIKAIARHRAPTFRFRDAPGRVLRHLPLDGQRRFERGCALG